MRIKIYSFCLVLCLSIVSLWGQVGDLPRSTPEEQGVESGAVLAMFEELLRLDLTDIHHVMVLRGGKVIAEMHPSPFKAEHSHTLYSCSKTFVSLAVGIAIDENRLRLSDRVAQFFPELLPDTISENLAKMTVRDLLTMASGVTPDWDYRSYEKEWVEPFLAKEVSEPGENFTYDSMSSYMLSAIVQRATGERVADYLRSRLFTPMGIVQYDWEESLDGINCGGWGLRLQAESLAKTGQLLLNKGEWCGKQLVSRSWIEEATKCQIVTTSNNTEAATDNNQGYGYQIWRCRYDGAYRADGAHGQFIVVVPDKDIVIVITGITTGAASRELDAIWDTLLSGVHDEELAPSPNYARMQKYSKNAALETIVGKKTSPLEEEIAAQKITLSDNKYNIASIKINALKDSYSLTIEYNDGKSHTLPYGYNNEWAYTTTTVPPPYAVNAIVQFKGLRPDYVVAGNYGWVTPSRLTLRSTYVNWISSRLYDFDFEAMTITISDNFSSLHTEVISLPFL